MKIDRVTITGADESINPEELVAISDKYPFVEWAILVSTSKEGVPRFPSKKWIDEFIKVKGLQRAIHICGGWIRKLIVDRNPEVFIDRPEFIESFPRIQLNFSHLSSNVTFLETLTPYKNQFIFQINKQREEKLNLTAFAKYKGINATALFDASGGKGKLPNKWPEYPGFYSGYAGGLGPDSIEEELKRIAEAVGENTIWIDMESRVRSLDDSKFELDKVVKCLEVVKFYV